MAREAILKIKVAEDAAKRRIASAQETAKQILFDADKESQKQKQMILERAEWTRKELVDSAVKKARTDCEAISLRTDAKKKAIQNLPKDKITLAIDFITERIVGV